MSIVSRNCSFVGLKLGVVTQVRADVNVLNTLRSGSFSTFERRRSRKLFPFDRQERIELAKWHCQENVDEDEYIPSARFYFANVPPTQTRESLWLPPSLSNLPVPRNMLQIRSESLLLSESMIIRKCRILVPSVVHTSFSDV